MRLIPKVGMRAMAIPSVPSALENFHRDQAVEVMRVARPVSLPAMRLPAGTASSASDPAILGLADSRSVVGKAGDALAEVRSSLAELAKLAARASDIRSTDDVDGVTRSAIQVDMRRIIARMDAAVEAAAVSGANLVSSASRDVRLQTTGLGGSIVAAVQALDSSALGLAGIDLSTDEGVTAAVAAVASAQADLAAKDVRIQALSLAYQGQGDFNTALQGVIASTALGYGGYGGDARTQSSAAATRGATVNVWA